jgi:hypothetical protein
MKCFLDMIIPNGGSDEHLFNTLCINLHEISFQLNWNKFEFDSMEFEWNWNSFQLSSSCTQCHSIFSFKWNLFFTKSIHFFHHFIVTSILKLKCIKGSDFKNHVKVGEELCSITIHQRWILFQIGDNYWRRTI